MEDECVSIDLPGRAHGRAGRPETSEILRLDEGIVELSTSRCRASSSGPAARHT
jgi:hypothetical protein